MNKKDILNHLKEQAQKAKGLANKTKQSIQDTAQRGASAAKKAVDKSIEKAQTASSQIKESIKSKKNVDKKASANTKNAQEPGTPKPAENMEKYDLSTDKGSKSFEKKRPTKICKEKNNTQSKSSVKGAVILATGLALGGVGVGIGIGVDDADTHCAYFSLEEEYHLMQSCINACNGYISGCAEKIRQFECQEKMTYSKAESRVNYSCPLYYK